MTSRVKSSLGPAASNAAGSLRRQITMGSTAAGEFLPPVRELARRHSVDMKTMWRALKGLESEGLVVAVARRGYRVLPRANDPSKGCPIAYLLGTSEAVERLDPAHQSLLAHFQQVAGAREWPLLAVSAEGRPASTVFEQLKNSRACGAVLDTVDPGLLRMAEESDLPALMVDAYAEDAELDAVLQDNHRGGMLAAKHLAAAGHRRIAWVGPRIANAHGSERLGGAVAGLALSGMNLAAGMRVALRDDHTAQERVQDIRALLSKTDRPTAVMALWRGIGGQVFTAATDLGLKIGKDLALVSWTAEESYEDTCRDNFGGRKPDMVVWSRREMAQAAVSRLAERRASPDLPIMRINVRTRLRTAEGKNRKARRSTS